MEFVKADVRVQRAVLLVAGLAYVVADPANTVRAIMVEASHDVAGADVWRGYVQRPHEEILKRRYPPTGDRETWMKYGPEGPPSSQQRAP